MPIPFPHVHQFDNNPGKIENYLAIKANYNKKKLSCDINSNSVKIFEKKWILSSEDGFRQLELNNEHIDFTLAQKFPWITCEGILYDGLFFKKDRIKFHYNKFENWPNTSPSPQKYTTSSISQFSISNFFKPKKDNEYYFCNGTSGIAEENYFCSLIDNNTGSIETKNLENHKIYKIFNENSFVIFNLNIGIKKEDVITHKNGIQIVIKNDDHKQSDLSLFYDTNYLAKRLVCKQPLFLYTPTQSRVIWYKNNVEIENQREKYLPEKYLDYNSSFFCKNSNGVSQTIKLNQDFLTIVGSEFVDLNEKSMPEYFPSLKIGNENHNWSCVTSKKIMCQIVKKTDSEAIQLNLSTNDNLIFESEVITIKLKINSITIKKKIFVTKKNINKKNTLNVSHKVKIEHTDGSDHYKCIFDSSNLKSPQFNIYWFHNENEVLELRNKSSISKFFGESKVSCIVFAIDQNGTYIGTTSLFSQNLSNFYPSWLKPIYLASIFKKNKIELFSETVYPEIKNFDCQISISDEILIKNACHLNKNKKVILNINQKNIDVFKNYFTKNPPLDIFNIKPFDLKIVVENRNGFRVYNSQLKFINSTQKPKIIASGIIDISDNTQKCFVISEDPQNLFISAEYNLENNKLKFNSQKNINSNILNLNHSSYYLKNGLHIDTLIFHGKYKENFCTIKVTNGTALEQTKTAVKSEHDFKTLLNSASKINTKKNKTITQTINKDKKIHHKLARENEHYYNFISIKNKDTEYPFFIVNKNEKVTYIKYSKSALLENMSQQENPTETTYKHLLLQPSTTSILTNYFTSVSIFPQKKNKNFSCIADIYPKSEIEIKSVQFKIFINNKLYLNKKTKLEKLDFEVKDLNENDTISCLIKVDKKIESASYTKNDIEEINSMCYGLGKNSSIVYLNCPKLQSTKDLKKLNEIIYQELKNMNEIEIYKMNLSTPTQKNKITLTVQNPWNKN